MKNMNPCNNLCAPPPPNAAAFSSGSHRRTVIVNGPVIVGAGPSGLAVAACLRRQGVPFVIVERANCIASLWQNRTYDRLSLHLPKQFCQLPPFPFPETFPEYPSRTQFLDYLHSYAAKFHIRPQFGESVTRAEPYGGLWRVATSSSVSDGSPSETEYLCRWLVVATGENAEKVVPEIEGARNFGGPSIHACDYKSGKAYEGKRVLVVGCGNSGMEVSLDLANHGALPSMLVRSSVHVLPREILGRSTYEVARVLTKWVPVWVVDKILVAAARLILGQTEEYGLRRPGLGPMELKQTEGKTPVLDIGAVEKIRSGGIKVVPAGIKKFSTGAVELDNGEILRVDSVVYATGYSSNVPYWLKGCDFFSKDGFPRSPFPNGWKGENGIYAAGFGRKGLLGASVDASKIAEDIGEIWRRETGLKHNSIGVKFNKKF